MKLAPFGIFLAATLFLAPSIALAQTATNVICTGCVGATDIASGAVTNAKVGNNAVTTGKIADGTITNADISDTAAIVASKIADGAASGLDADLFDGLESSQFLRSDQSGTLSGNLSVSGPGGSNVMLGTTDSFGPGIVLGGSTSFKLFSTNSGDSEGSDQFVLRNVGSGEDLLLVDSGGNVSIGTNHSDAEFHVSDPSAGAFMRVSGFNGVYGIYMGADENQPYVGTYTDSDLRFVTNATEKARLTSGGYLGIGTATPDRSLTVSNATGANYMNVKDGTREILLGVDTTTVNGVSGAGILSVMSNNGLVIRTGGNSDKMVIDTNGNVGIGTTTPSYPLDVNGISQAHALEARSSGGTPYVDFSNDTTSDYDARLILVGDDALSLQGTTDFSMDANVGIGTNYSDAELHVNDPSSGAVVKVSGNNGTYGLYMGADSGSPYIGSYTDHKLRFVTNGTERMRIAADGDVGIGIGDISPDYLLSVGEADMGFDPVDTDALGFFTAGTEVMRLTSGGNVKVENALGIRTAPNYPFHIEDSTYYENEDPTDDEDSASDRDISFYLNNSVTDQAVYGIRSLVASGGSNSIGVFGEATHVNPDTSGGTFGVFGRVDRTSGTSGHSSAGVFGDASGPDTSGDGKPEAFDSLANGVQGETWSTNSEAAGGKFIAAQSTGEAIGVDARAYSDDATGLRIVSDGKLIEGRACNESNSDGIDSDGDGSDTDSACSSSTVVFKVTNAGNVTADGTYDTPATDLAEYVNTLDDLQPGEVIEIDPTRPDHFRRSQSAQSRLVAGVVSTKPGVVLGVSEGTGRSLKVLLALAGRVPVKVTNENGPIQIGDLLVTSSTPGYAMKCTVAWRCAGSVLGKALENMNEEQGTVTALISLQ